MGMFLNRGNVEFTDAVNSQIYVDKTDMVEFFNHVINTEQRYVSVSRPRRFGKSMAANMLAAYFEKGCDSRFLFENRKLGQIPDWDRNLNKYDVIRIDIADIRAGRDTSEEALDEIESGIINDLATAFPQAEVVGTDTVVGALDKVNRQTGSRFVIIIDEWDCLFRDDKNNTKVQEKYINLLRGLFKGNRSKMFLALGYITGILPIKKYNSESALNNFDEYTMLQPDQLAEYIGFTEEEVRELCEQHEMDYEKMMEWYDGYSFQLKKHICGPNSVRQAITRRNYNNYWSQTAAFSSLLTHITMNFDGLKEDIKVMLGGQRVKVRVTGYQNDMTSFQTKHDVLTVLIHLGYLAYDSEKEEVYIPNKEVREIFEICIESAGWNELVETIEASEELLLATINGDADEVAAQMDACHAANTSILNYNNENALASCIMLAYYTARKEYMIVREFPSGYGRSASEGGRMPPGEGFADLVFLPKQGVDKPAMVVELKWNQKAETAISQIKEKKYDGALKDYKGRVLLVGISYEKGKRGERGKAHECVIEEWR